MLTFNILEIAQVNIPEEAQKLFFPITFIGFAVLGALFPFHTWSPDGHASAPTAVSMLHAGVLMKLGGYGVFRISMYLLPQGAIDWSWFFIILSGYIIRFSTNPTNLFKAKSATAKASGAIILSTEE